MKRKIVLAISMLILVLTGLSIGGIANAYKSWSSRLAEDDSPWQLNGALMNSFEQQYNLAKSELSVRDYERFYWDVGGRFMQLNLNSEAPTLWAFNQRHPVELVKKIDDEHICVVYKLARDDLREVFAYVVFEKWTSTFDDCEEMDPADEYELWHKTGEFYFITEELTSDDFSGLCIGDSAAIVNEIDQSVSFETVYSRGFVETKTWCFESYRLLKDGILIIAFEAPHAEGTVGYPPLDEFKITSIVFYPFGDDTMPDKISICEPLF